jgi:hypothetical protein
VEARAWLAVVLGLALACAACGEGDEDKYKEEFPPLSRELSGLGPDVGQSLKGASGSSDEQLADDFDNYAEQFGQVQQEIDELEPPDDLAEDQDQLVSAIGEVQGALEDIAEAAGRGDAQAARRATLDLIQSYQDLRSSRSKLSAAVREL